MTHRIIISGTIDLPPENLQDALDAAAPGDSILIGPGRFDTFRPARSVVDNFPFAAIAWVTTTDLTIIGAGRDQTISGAVHAHGRSGWS